MLEQLEKLDQIALTLKTGNELRDAEVNNIRAVIMALTLECEEENILVKVEDVHQRLMVLIHNPLYAGKHEQFRQS